MMNQVAPLQELLQLCLERQLNFAAYREPGGTVQTVIQREQMVGPLSPKKDISEQVGFLVSPYRDSGSCKSMLIAPDIVINGDQVDEKTFREVSNFEGKKEYANNSSSLYECDRDEYVEQVETLINLIRENRFSKAVLSRVKVVPGDQRQKLIAMFIEMCRKYPYSLIYIFQAEDHLWIGATPELLASICGELFKTVSLAATRMNLPANQDISRWSQKERQEQRYVTDFIAEVLKDCNVKSATRGNTYLRRASNLLHLCTEFNCDAGEIRGKLTPLLNRLHPTPAVCGIPRTDVMDFVASLEKHERQYYSGFLGPVNITANQISLYVNLRSMRVLPDHARIFVGGGLTIDSNAMDEWSETILKTKTILSVLHATNI
jgi:isochorismate synthase